MLNLVIQQLNKNRRTFLVSVRDLSTPLLRNQIGKWSVRTYYLRSLISPLIFCSWGVSGINTPLRDAGCVYIQSLHTLTNRTNRRLSKGPHRGLYNLINSTPIFNMIIIRKINNDAY
jgi:hypothetical protein